RMREDVCGAGERHRQDELLVACVEARLVTEGERRPDLDPRGAGPERLVETLGRAVSARQPERKPQFAELREIDDIPFPVNRLARGGELEAAAGWRVVASSRRALHDEAVHPPVRLSDERQRERVRRDDREEERAL